MIFIMGIILVMALSGCGKPTTGFCNCDEWNSSGQFMARSVEIVLEEECDAKQARNPDWDCWWVER